MGFLETLVPSIPSKSDILSFFAKYEDTANDTTAPFGICTTYPTGSLLASSWLRLLYSSSSSEVYGVFCATSEMV
jgi:hypothetical protein